jgi:hypothetical protein
MKLPPRTQSRIAPVTSTASTISRLEIAPILRNSPPAQVDTSVLRLISGGYSQ